MKSCKHFLLSNSTFSWWAMWLNELEKKIVIAPFPIRKISNLPKDSRKFYLENHILVNPFATDNE